MCDPRIMCRQHLLGEHVEHHMFVGSINKGKPMTGFLRKNLLEPLSLIDRHNKLAFEIKRRGYNHMSPLPLPHFDKDEPTLLVTIDREKALADLLARCPECRERHAELLKQSETLDQSFFKGEEA